MTNNERVIANTLGGTFIITLPASPTLGDYLQISDGGDFSVNQLIIEPNGSTIEGLVNTQIGLDIANTTYEFLYDGTTWQISATTGRAGYTGSDGQSGAFAGMGYTGSYGALGPIGSQGPQGIQGYMGYTGSSFTTNSIYIISAVMSTVLGM